MDQNQKVPSKKQYRIKPSLKQRTAAKNILLNHKSKKPKSVAKILVESGYSKNQAIASTQVTTSRGFIMALEQAGVTDNKISKIMNEGLDALKDGEPDHAIRHKYMETAIKVKGYTTPEEAPSNNTYNTFIQQNSINPNAPEAKQLVDDTLAFLMDKTRRET